jgi:hypothetical protein
MTCARGCCVTQAEHYRSLRIASPDRRAMTKRTECDGGSEGSAVVTEHWHDRQDVLVRPTTVRAIRMTAGVEQANG